MTNWIISSSVLILIVICMRHFQKGKISAKLQYAMWIIVAIRLLMPLSFGSSMLSVENITNRLFPTVESTIEDATVQNATASEENIQNVIFEDAVLNMEVQGRDENHETTYVPTERKASYTDILRGIWLMGMGCIAGTFLVINSIFQRKIKKSRKEIYVNWCKMPIYVSDEVETPCLVGLFSPKIYVTKEVAEHCTLLRHTVTHEMMHHKQGDSLWAIIRCACLALHWYNPLVWWAAILSKKDAEFSCDEATIKELGEAERKEYGKTLIQLSSKEKYNLFLTATAMTSGKKSIKERIILIAKQPRVKWYTLLIGIVIVCIAIGCTFTKGKASQDSISDKGINQDSADSIDGTDNIDSFIVHVSDTKEITIKLDTVLLENSNYKINEILVYDGEEHIQTIQVPTEPFAEEYAWDGLFINMGHEVGEPDIRDVNFDGAEDLGLMTVSRYPKNVPYCYYIWNEAKNCFEYGFTLFGASALTINTEYQWLIETAYDTKGETSSLYDYVEDGSLTEIQEPLYYKVADKEKVCLAVMPDGISQAGGDYRYIIPEDQTKWMDGYKQMCSMASGDGKWNSNERSMGVWIVYGDEWTCITDQGFIFDFEKRIKKDEAEDFYNLCMEEARKNGTGTPVRPEEISDIASATLQIDGYGAYAINDDAILAQLQKSLSTSTELRGGAACPFTASLILKLENGKSYIIYLATDTCSTWISDGVYYEDNYDFIVKINDMIAARNFVIDFTEAYFANDVERLQEYRLPTSSVAFEGYGENDDSPIIYDIKGLEACIDNFKSRISVEFRVSEDADYFVYLEMNIFKHNGEWKVESYWLEHGECSYSI